VIYLILDAFMLTLDAVKSASLPSCFWLNILCPFSDKVFSILLLQTAMNIGISASNLANSRHPSQPYHSSAPLPLSSHSSNVVSSPAPTPQVPSLSLSASSNPTPLQDTLEPIGNSNLVTNLLKPSSFFAPPSSSSALIMPPISSSVPTAPVLHPPLNLQRPYGTPMLQPFPPPTPPLSLTPSSSPTNDGLLISRDKVRDTLLMLVQVSPSFLFFFFPWLSNLFLHK
jgi:mRNA-decapping enzyme 1B